MTTEITAPEAPKEMERKRISIFRSTELTSLAETMERSASTAPQALEGIDRVVNAGLHDGLIAKVAFRQEGPIGLSLIHCWFKKGVPLPPHSHNVDCLYYIISGSLKFGTEKLGPGDGMMVPADAVYSFTAVGDEGVEFLEIRNHTMFDVKSRSLSKVAWDKYVSRVEENRDAWRQSSLSPLEQRKMAAESE